MIEVPASDCSLRDCLTSGQAFRWREHGGWWYGVLGPAAVRVRQENGCLLAESSDAAVGAEGLRRYFGLDHDLAAILRTIDVDAQVHEAIARRRGLRVLRQDGWETLASFICASFNNIRRIEGMLERLCQAYGRPVALDGFRSFAFPTPEVLAATSERRLRALGLGYRAPYVRATAQLVAEHQLPLEHLGQLDYETVRRALLGCDGVGEKVADCVALFGFGKHDAFPVDVWVGRVMRYYFRHRRATPKRIREYARRHFGPWAGWAQQYLYHDIRMRHTAEGAAGGRVKGTG